MSAAVVVAGRSMTVEAGGSRESKRSVVRQKECANSTSDVGLVNVLARAKEEEEGEDGRL